MTGRVARCAVHLSRTKPLVRPINQNKISEHIMEMRYSRLACLMALIFSAGAAGAAPASVHGVNMQAFGSIRIPALAGWPDAISTGYQNAPGYPGKLTTYSAVANGTECSGPIESGKTYQYCYFPNGLEIGSVGVVGTPANVTFYGCLFETGFNGVGGSQSITKYTNGNNISFSYSTFQPTG